MLARPRGSSRAPLCTEEGLASGTPRRWAEWGRAEPNALQARSLRLRPGGCPAAGGTGGPELLMGARLTLAGGFRTHTVVSRTKKTLAAPEKKGP